jgi:hypothetical protein
MGLGFRDMGKGIWVREYNLGDMDYNYGLATYTLVECTFIHVHINTCKGQTVPLVIAARPLSVGKKAAAEPATVPTTMGPIKAQG